MSSQSPVIMWFRQDLRLSDNPALHHAVQSGQPIICLYVFEDGANGTRKLGAAQKWWLNQSLQKLTQDLEKIQATLVLRKGSAADIIDKLVEETGANAIYWNRRYGEAEQAVDTKIKAGFNSSGLAAKSFNGLLLHEPATTRTKSDKPYRVYTPFWKNFVAQGSVRALFPVPTEIKSFGKPLSSDDLSDWNLHPSNPDWSKDMASQWTPGEAGAQEALRQYAEQNLTAYATARDFPGIDRTSRLSPHLRFGEISPHMCWHACYSGRYQAGDTAREIWAKELVWREFAYHLFHHWPDLASVNFNRKFDSFPWKHDEVALKAWQRGQTGYPIVDAGMRQLWQTGWMHNRVRMIVGSFLVKHLLIDWRYGEQWFWDTLLDGDPASNPAQWQWVAGSGADASPYFRVFNPILQSQKFDPDGTYIRKYVPELAKLSNGIIHTPWEASPLILRSANVELGNNYPKPIIDHKAGRERALKALATTNQLVE